jgi:hypothetical protein
MGAVFFLGTQDSVLGTEPCSVLRQNAAETRVLDGLVRMAELCTVVARENGLAIGGAADAAFVIGLGTAGSALGARRLHDI